jgi:hypothetical protein
LADEKASQQLKFKEIGSIFTSYLSKKYFTIEEQLFVYLLQYNNLQNNYVIPDLITQQGITNALDCDRSFISRLLRKNEREGLIFRKLIKIENKKRKQNAFFLTEEGIKYAFMLTKSISASDKKKIF